MGLTTYIGVLAPARQNVAFNRSRTRENPEDLPAGGVPAHNSCSES